MVKFVLRDESVLFVKRFQNWTLRSPSVIGKSPLSTMNAPG